MIKAGRGKRGKRGKMGKRGKSFASLFKGCRGPGGRAPWSHAAACETPQNRRRRSKKKQAAAQLAAGKDRKHSPK